MSHHPPALSVNNSSTGHPGSPHPEFKGAGSQPGLLIWRIEDKVPTPWPESKYGTFHTGDSYICLQTKVLSSGYEWNIHFWLGKDSSVDEIGIAAIKTIELDDSLGGLPTQYRETQGYESNKFQALFKKGIMYLDGGVDSGFRHVERDQFPTRLFQLKGKRNVRVTQISLTSDINSGDVFILDKGLTIFQWNGKASNKYERAKALDVVVGMKDDERQGRASVVRVDEGDEPDEFWSAFGDRRPRILSADAGGDDSAAEAQASKERKLFRVQGGGCQAVDTTGAPKHANLKPDGVFLLDCGSEVFVWVGKDASGDDRRGAMKAGMDYVAREGKPAHTPLSKVLHDSEPPLFKDKFSDWPRQKMPAVDFSKTHSAGRVASSGAEHAVGDLARVMSGSRLTPGGAGRRQEAAFGDGSGTIRVWRVENFDLAAVPEETWGQFYSGDSYLVLYEYLDNGKQAWVIYFWLGRHSSTDEIGTAAMKAKEMDDQYGGEPVQVRVTQNKEPAHFLRLFKGRFIIHDGGNPSGFRTASEELEHHDGTGLYHIKGATEVTTRAVQVEKTAESLNSCDAFVLLTHDTIFAWYGRKCTPDERSISKKTADILRGARREVEVTEGEEPSEFWAELGGKKDYPEGSPDEDSAQPPRLFQCSNASGTFEAEIRPCLRRWFEHSQHVSCLSTRGRGRDGGVTMGLQVDEVVDFAQDDLNMDDTFILDDGKEVFVWVGPEANELEKRKVMELAEEYVTTAGDARKGTPIMRVDAGKEPPLFTCHFLGWDHHKAKTFEDPYEKKLREMRSESSSAGAQPSTPYAGVQLKKSPFSTPSGSAAPETPSPSTPFAVNLSRPPKAARKTPGSSTPGASPHDAAPSTDTPPWAVKLKSTGRSLDDSPQAASSSSSPAMSRPPVAPKPDPIAGLQDFESPVPQQSPIAAPQSPVTNTPLAFGAASSTSPATPSANHADWRTTKFSYADLKSRSASIEGQIDPARRANYLSDDEFKQVMGCTVSEFEAMKEWKKTDLKKKAGLF